MRTKSNLKAFLLLWCWISLLGLIALASKRLGHCGHISSSFGKYFEAEVVEKTRRILALGCLIKKGDRRGLALLALISTVVGLLSLEEGARASTVGLFTHDAEFV